MVLWYIPNDEQWVQVSSVWFSMFGLFNDDNRGISEFNPSVFSVPRMATMPERVFESSGTRLYNWIFASAVCGFYCGYNLCYCNSCTPTNKTATALSYAGSNCHFSSNCHWSTGCNQQAWFTISYHPSTDRSGLIRNNLDNVFSFREMPPSNEK